METASLNKTFEKLGEKPQHPPTRQNRPNLLLSPKPLIKQPTRAIGEIMPTYGLTLRYQNKNISQDHNSRDMQHHKRTDIDYTKSIVPYIHIKAKQFYNDFFKESLAEYNKKQKRADRKINDYYEYIAKDRQKNLYNEIMFKLGDLNDKLKDPKQYKEDSDIFKKICYEYVDTFIEKYPNLKVIGAYYHQDEKGADHIHINYVPIAYNQTRGLSVQVSNEKALNQLGFKTTKESTAQMQFTTQINKEFESKVKEKFKIKEHGKSRGYTLTNTEYKQAKKELNKQLEQDKSLIFFKETELAKLVKTQGQIDELEEQKIIKTNAIINRQKAENDKEFKFMHRHELEERQAIIDKNSELVKTYDKNLEIYKNLTSKIDTKQNTLNDLNKKIEIAKTNLKDVEQSLSKEQKAKIVKQVEKRVEDKKTELDSKIKQLEQDNSKTYRELYKEEMSKRIKVEIENDNLKSTIREFFDLAKEHIGNALSGIWQFLKKFHPTEHDTLKEVVEKDTPQKENGRQL